MTGERVAITAAGLSFVARLESEKAPRSADWFRGLLPYEAKILQARWSGFAAWVPLGVDHVDVPVENATYVPPPGHLLLYPGGASEPEILFPYGSSIFTSVAGPLVGNQFLTIVDGADHLGELGRRVQWDGAQDVSFALLVAD